MSKTRKFIISWNNYPTHITLEKLKDRLLNKASVEYLILGYEVGEKEQTPHIQGYVRFTNPQHFNSIRKLLENENGTYGYLKEANGNDKANQKYCSKQNNFIEYGLTSDDEEESDSKIEKEQELIDDIINDMPFKDLIKKHSHYILYHYRDFKILYYDLKQLTKDNKIIDNIKRIENELGVIIENGTGTNGTK